jgi:hypothetical protein
MARALDTGPNQSGGERLTLATGYDKNRAIRTMFRKGALAPKKKAPQCGTGLSADRRTY